jgi:hypothetical protein
MSEVVVAAALVLLMVVGNEKAQRCGGFCWHDYHTIFHESLFTDVGLEVFTAVKI